MNNSRGQMEDFCISINGIANNHVFTRLRVQDWNRVGTRITDTGFRLSWWAGHIGQDRLEPSGAFEPCLA